MIPQIKQRIEQIRRGEVPEGYKNTKGGIVPDEWVEDNLGRYLSEYKKLSNDIEKYPVYSSSRQGLIPQSKYYDNREAVETCVGYKIVPTGYVTYRHMSDDDIFHFNVNRTGGKILVSSEYPVFTVSDKGELGYIIPMLNDTARFRYFCRTQKLGGTRTRLYYKNLCAYRTAFPTYPEQKKIADILSAQDKLIELQQKKIDELKRLKKVYLSKMFPQKGCNVPEIRFPGFTDVWEQRKFSDLYEKVSRKNDLTYGKDDVISVANMYYKADSYITDESYLLTYNVFELGDIAFEGNKSKNFAHGRFVENTIGNGIVSHVFDVFKPIMPKYDLMFWKYAINNERLMGGILLRSTKASTMMTNLVASDFLQEHFLVPRFEEQKKIGDFFARLDNLITLHRRKLDEEQKKKKSLMQLLLTGIVRVEVK